MEARKKMQKIKAQENKLTAKPLSLINFRRILKSENKRNTEQNPKLKNHTRNKTQKFLRKRNESEIEKVIDTN